MGIIGKADLPLFGQQMHITPTAVRTAVRGCWSTVEPRGVWRCARKYALQTKSHSICFKSSEELWFYHVLCLSCSSYSFQNCQRLNFGATSIPKLHRDMPCLGCRPERGAAPGAPPQLPGWRRTPRPPRQLPRPPAIPGDCRGDPCSANGVSHKHGKRLKRFEK